MRLAVAYETLLQKSLDAFQNSDYISISCEVTVSMSGKLRPAVAYETLLQKSLAAFQNGCDLGVNAEYCNQHLIRRNRGFSLSGTLHLVAYELLLQKSLDAFQNGVNAENCNQPIIRRNREFPSLLKWV